jgi:riboflavin synthase
MAAEASMFTGIVSDLGTLAAHSGARLSIACSYDPSSLVPGASIACDGCCLTIVSARTDQRGAIFEVDVSNETSARTTLGNWQVGRRINLERPLAFGDELGGHLVTGHIDGFATITGRAKDGDSVRFTLETPAGLAKFIAAKGAIALDGISLTVNEVDGKSFSVNIIPYTLVNTTWRDHKPGDLVNLEVDMLARYVERIAVVKVSEK